MFRIAIKLKSKEGDENLVMGIRLRRVRLRRERRVRHLYFIAILKFGYANYI